MRCLRKWHRKNQSYQFRAKKKKCIMAIGGWDTSHCWFYKITWLCICSHLQEFKLRWHPNTMVSFNWVSSVERVLRGPPGQALERRVGRGGEVASLVFPASLALSKKRFSNPSSCWFIYPAHPLLLNLSTSSFLGFWAFLCQIPWYSTFFFLWSTSFPWIFLRAPTGILSK